MNDPKKTTDQLRADLAFRLRAYLEIVELGAPESILANEHRLVTDASERLLGRLESDRLSGSN
jgi:hypothetical protein